MRDRMDSLARSAISEGGGVPASVSHTRPVTMYFICT